LAGAADDITTPEQVRDATKFLGTPEDHIAQKTVPGGHIGLFMGAKTLKQHWPGNCPMDLQPLVTVSLGVWIHGLP
jgi:poly(3-hydroxyalkanoate) synthetase